MVERLKVKKTPRRMFSSGNATDDPLMLITTTYRNEPSIVFFAKVCLAERRQGWQAEAYIQLKDEGKSKLRSMWKYVGRGSQNIL